MTLLALIVALTATYALHSVAGRTQKIQVDEFYCASGPFAVRQTISRSALRSLPSLQKETSKGSGYVGRRSHVFEYKGLTIWVSLSTNEHEIGVVQAMKVSSPDWLIAGGVQVGVSVSDLSSRLGKPIDPNASEVMVCGDTDCATYYIKGKRLTEIDYHCYSG